MKFVREPLVHFLLIGALLFALYAWAGKRSADSGITDGKITVSAQRVAMLKQGFLLDNGRAATDAEVQKLIESYIREEVLVRAAAAQGLDREDSVVRRRLAQRMDFAAPEPAPPTEAQLKEYLAAHPDEFKTADGKVPDYAQIVPAVTAAWMTQQRRKGADEMYQRLRTHYQITIEASKGEGAR